MTVREIRLFSVFVPLMPRRQAEYSGAAIHRSIQPRDGHGPIQVFLRARPMQQETAVGEQIKRGRIVTRKDSLLASHALLTIQADRMVFWQT